MLSKQNTDTKVDAKRNRALRLYQSLDPAALREAQEEERKQNYTTLGQRISGIFSGYSQDFQSIISGDAIKSCEGRASCG